MPTFGDVDPIAVAPATNDFWRTVGGTLPDGVNDTTEDIQRTGLVGIGNIPASDPIAQLDVAAGVRSGVDGRVAGQPFYATGNLPSLGNGTSPPATPVAGAEFRHSNQSQGIGIAFNGLYATGSVADQDFGFLQRGNGQYFFHWQAQNASPGYFTNFVGAAITGVNQGWNERWFAAGTQEFGALMRRTSRVNPGAGTLANEWFFQGRNELGTFRNKMWLGPSKVTSNLSRVEIGENDINDDKLVLFGIDSATFFGFGMKSATLAYFIQNNSHHHRWYQGSNPGTQLMGLSGVGNLTLDPTGVAAANWTSPVLRFGSESSGEGIRSQRTVVDRFQNNLEFYTASLRRGAFLANGRFYLAVVPTFATDALAGAGGLAVGEVYKDALGTLKIKL